MDDYETRLAAEIAKASNADNAAAMKKYLRHKFEFFGVKTPERKAIVREFVSEHGLPCTTETIIALWHQPHRECHHAAIDLLDRMKRHYSPAYFVLCEQLITTHSWWDTVDALATRQIATLFKRYPEEGKECIEKWRHSDNIWLRRTTLLYQLKYSNETDVELLTALIRENADSDEFFIQKAIGWALREYAKTDAHAVRQLTASIPLKSLSVREALKHIGK